MTRRYNTASDLFTGITTNFSLGSSVFQALWNLYQTSNTIAALLDKLPDLGATLRVVVNYGLKREPTPGALISLPLKNTGNSKELRKETSPPILHAYT